jgi:hypothetical protein
MSRSRRGITKKSESEAGETNESRGTRQPPPLEPKTGAASLREQFRHAVEIVTRRAPAPAPAQRRRRTEETRGGFRLAVAKIVRWAIRRTPPAVTDPPEAERFWLSDTMDWLQLWADNEATTAPDATHEPARPDSPDDPPDFSPGL